MNNNYPRHVAMIMDGNRRWAKGRRLPIFEGHRRGEERIEPIIDEAIALGIRNLTFWAFSTENWKRKEREIGFLMNLFRIVLNRKIGVFHEKNVRLRVIGDISKFPKDIKKSVGDWVEKTAGNTKITVNMALNYGGRDEIVRAVQKVLSNSEFRISNSKFTDKVFEEFLDTSGQPDPDLIIRTGGVKRLSGFMLWQSEYSELYFTDTNWPDFTTEEFKKALEYYQCCQRRFGS